MTPPLPLMTSGFDSLVMLWVEWLAGQTMCVTTAADPTEKEGKGGGEDDV